MRFHEIISERSLADVGVRADKFYLSAKGEQINWDEFLSTGKLHGVKGISSSRYIWRDFGPNVSRDVFFVMPAQDVLRLNKIHRIGYDDAEALVANNSYKFGRILSVTNVARDGGDNMIKDAFPKQDEFRRADPNSVINNAMSIAMYLRKGEAPTGERFDGVIDVASFGDFAANGLRLSSIADYANLFYQASKAAGWYGKEYVKYFAPQNRRQWYPAISQRIVQQANTYADEAEWVVDSTEFIVPPSTHVVLAIPPQFQSGVAPSEEERESLRWSDYDDKRLAYYNALIDGFRRSKFKFAVVNANKAANSLIGTRTKKLA